MQAGIQLALKFLQSMINGWIPVATGMTMYFQTCLSLISSLSVIVPRHLCHIFSLISHPRVGGDD